MLPLEDLHIQVLGSHKAEICHSLVGISNQNLTHIYLLASHKMIEPPIKYLPLKTMSGFILLYVFY